MGDIIHLLQPGQEKPPPAPETEAGTVPLPPPTGQAEYLGPLPKPKPKPAPKRAASPVPEREIEVRARELLPADWLFEEEPLPTHDRPLQDGDIVVFDTRVNAALRLAYSADMMGLLSHCLWGDEAEKDVVRLGLLARGAVITFCPVTMYDLYAVVNIVSAQWKLDRMLRLQKKVFESEAKNGQIGKYGLPQATWIALSFDEDAAKLQKMLDGAIRSYQLSAKRKTKRERENW
jgi:hypothetical protein